MKELSQNTTEAIDAPYVGPVRLVEITIGSLTLYLSDRAFGDNNNCTFDGQLYEPFIIGWGRIQTGKLDPVTYESEPSNASFIVDNSKPIGGADQFTGLFASTDPQYSTVRISEIYGNSTVAADEIVLFAGNIEDLPEMSETRVTIACSGYELDVLNKFDFNIIDATTYPSADPDDLGKMAPQIYGTVKKTPCIAIDAGGKTTITEEMFATSPGDGGTLGISDGTAFPAAGPFTVQVDSEQIRIASRSGNILTLAASGARGYGTTTAVDHDAGAAIAEIQTEYIYMVADHPVNSIDEVYVENIRQVANFTVYTGKTGDELTGYAGKAMVVFDTLPIYAKQINIVIEENLGVDSSSRGAADAGHAHESASQVIEYPFTSAFVHASSPGGAGTPTGASNLVDGNKSGPASCVFTLTDERVDLRKSSAPSYSGLPQQVRLCASIGYVSPTAGWNLRSAGGFTLYIGDTDGYSIKRGAWFGVTSTTDTWAELQNLNPYITHFDAGGYPGEPLYPHYRQCWLYEVWAEVRYTPAGSDLGYSNVALTGQNAITGTVTSSGNSTADTVIGENVSVDCSGYIDDASGTYTGVANALIERPNHIARHILINRCGLTSDQIDLESYLISGNFYRDYSYVLGFPILQRPNPRALLYRVATQAKTIEFWDAGQHYMKPQGSYSVQKYISGNRIDQQQLYLRYTDRVNIKNTLTARYAREWSGHRTEEQAEQSVVYTSDPTSIAAKGVLQGDPESFPYVLGATQAQDLIDWRLDDSKNARLVAELSGGYYLNDIQLGDVIAFPVSLDSEILTALLGLVTNDLHGFLVIEKNYRADGSTQLVAISTGLVAATLVAVDSYLLLTADQLSLITMDANMFLTADNLDLVQQNVMVMDDATIGNYAEQVRFSSFEEYLLKEDWDFLLQETGDKLVLEALSIIMEEEGGSLLQENGDLLYQEQ